MKKKLSFFLLVLTFAIFSFSMNSSAVQNDTSYKDGQILSESDSLDEAYLTYTSEELSELEAIPDNSIDPLADELEKAKTITSSYSKFSDIPEYYSYSEYSDGHWWWGNLPLVKTEKIGGGWVATFSGYVYTLVE